MKILIVGSGGREHALAWQLAKSKHVTRIFCAPGNAGTAEFCENVPIPVPDILGGGEDKAKENIANLVTFALQNNIDLTVVGPEAPLFAGIVNAFEASGLTIFGPTAQAAQIEESKAQAKQMMNRAGISTAEHRSFDDYDKAYAYIINDCVFPCCVKASGPAKGKGVIICNDHLEAENAILRLMARQTEGPGGATVVIEEFLDGSELSGHYLCDGNSVLALPFVRDYKSAYNHSSGPMTGGMGAVTPIIIDSHRKCEFVPWFIKPALKQMQDMGMPYKGVLFPGFMLTIEGPKVLEFNCRFGDPETEALMPRLESDLFELLMATCRGTLDSVEPKWSTAASCTVVLASGGYPGRHAIGKVIEGVEDAEKIPGVTVFHCGTARKDGQLVTAGGRVLAVTCLGDDHSLARRGAYEAIKKIDFDGMHYRTDIGESLCRAH